MLANVAHPQVGVPMGGAGAGAPMQSWMELWNEWEIQTVVVASFSLQVILFFLAGIRRYSVSFVLKVLLWLVYLLADVVATYALGHISSSLSCKSAGEHQLVGFWAPFLLLHLGGQDTITAYTLEDNELWLRHLLNMFVQVAGTAYVLYKYINAGGATFVPTAMLVLVAGVVKYGERIWALKLASKGGSEHPSCGINFLEKIRFYFFTLSENFHLKDTKIRKDCFTKNKQFETYASIVLTAHMLHYVLVKPLIIDRNGTSIDWSDTTIALLNRHAEGGYLQEDNENTYASREEKRKIGERYKSIELQLALMYDMLYTKAQVIHTWYGYCTRAISLVSCFAALVIVTNSKRDGYSTPDIFITFALLGGACGLEIASVFKAIGSTWTYAVLNHSFGWKWLATAILFARYHLVVLKDGRWSNSVGQYNFISFCVHINKHGLKRAIAEWVGLKDWWGKAHCTKHAKLSPSLKEFVWGLLKGDKSCMVEIEEVDIRSGNWARKFRGFDQSEKLNWSMSFEFRKSVLIWHIATSTFLDDPDVKSELVSEDMAEEVNTLSHYMMYLLIHNPGILPVKAAARSLFDETCNSFLEASGSSRYLADPHQIILKYKEMDLDDMIIQKYNKVGRDDKKITELYGDLTHPSWDKYPGEAVLVKACSLAHRMLDMELGLAHKMTIIGAVWTEMLCYAATNASDGFHARQLSNGGEFLTHILLLTKYAAAAKAADETVDDGCNNEITAIMRSLKLWRVSNPILFVCFEFVRQLCFDFSLIAAAEACILSISFPNLVINSDFSSRTLPRNGGEWFGTWGRTVEHRMFGPQSSLMHPSEATFSFVSRTLRSWAVIVLQRN